jgi:protein ImuB
MLGLPAEGVARRFGPEIVVCLEKLVGRLADPRLPHVPPPQFHARLELPAEADGVEALLFPLRRMLVELEGSMRGRGAGVQQLDLVLEHGRKARTRVALDFASPEREVEFILAIAREKLSRLTLSAPTIAMALHADALLAYAPRNAAWLPGAAEQAIDRARLIERLAARLGSDRVFGIALKDDHRPERSWSTGCARVKRRLSDAHDLAGARPAWLLHHPQRLIAQDGQPAFQGALDLIAGPERIEAGWWDGAEVRRDYYVAANARGERFWIFREHRGPQGWYLHGVFA